MGSRDLLKRFVAESKHQVMERSEESDKLNLNLELSLGGRFGVEVKPTRLLRSLSAVDSDRELKPTRLVRSTTLPLDIGRPTRLVRLSTVVTPQSTPKRQNKDAIVHPPKRTATLPRLEPRPTRLIRSSSALPMNSDEKRQNKDVIAHPPKRTTVLPRLEPRPSRLIRSSSVLPMNNDEYRKKKEVECLLRKERTKLMKRRGSRQLDSHGSVGTSTSESSRSLHDLGFNDTRSFAGARSVAEQQGMKEMPSVSAKTIGPNGERVQGFLYKYKNGEVRIVCLCHGRFLSPAEFVKHAGGVDVQYPLQEIIINTK